MRHLNAMITLHSEKVTGLRRHWHRDQAEIVVPTLQMQSGRFAVLLKIVLTEKPKNNKSCCPNVH